MGGYLNFGRFGGAGSAMSIEVVELSVTGTSHTVNLTKGQNYAQCVPFATWRLSVTSSSATSQRGLDVYMVDNGGTPAVRVDRASAVTMVPVITIYVVEFESDIEVQQIAWSAPSAADFTVACSAVDTDYAFILEYATATDTGTLNRMDGNCAKVTFNSGTEIQFDRYAADNAVTGHVFVVEDTTGGGHFRVQTASASRSTTGNSDVNLASAVDLGASFLISTFTTNEASFNPPDVHWYVQMLDTDTVRFTVGGDAGDTRDMHCQVIEWLDGSVSVQHLVNNFSTDTTFDVETETIAINAVDEEKSVVFGNFKSWIGMNSLHAGFTGGYSANARCRIASGGESINLEYLTPNIAETSNNFRGWVAEFTL